MSTNNHNCPENDHPTARVSEAPQPKPTASSSSSSSACSPPSSRNAAPQQHQHQPSAASLAALRRVLLKGRASREKEEGPSDAATATATTTRGAKASSSSTLMRWSPYNVFASKAIAIEEVDDAPGSRRDELYNVVEYRWARDPFLKDAEGKEADKSWGAALPLSSSSSSSSSPSPSPPLAILRERREACGTSVNDIRCAQRDGIDNTGNFHWPTEDLMCYFMVKRWFEPTDEAVEDAKEQAAGLGEGNNTACPLFSSSSLSSQHAPQRLIPLPSLRLKDDGNGEEGITFVELGAGCGLASFVLAHCASRLVGAARDRVRIITTDGNSRVVETLVKNAQLQYPSPPSSEVAGGVTSDPSVMLLPMHLPWQSRDHIGKVFGAVGGEEERADKRGRARRKVLFGADCLFFEDFHHHLADLIISFHQRFSRPLETNGNGGSRPLTLLMAPSRGGSFERFEMIFKNKIIEEHAANKNASSNTNSSPSTNSVGDQTQCLAPPPPLITIRREESFDPFIHALHAELVKKKEREGNAEEGEEEAATNTLFKGLDLNTMRRQYNPDRHYPMLLVIE